MTKSNYSNKIYVFPYLRETSRNRKEVYNGDPVTNSISIQKEELEVPNQISFKYVQHNEYTRNEPGDLIKFIDWFMRNIWFSFSNQKVTNVLIFCHSNVMFTETHKHYSNNTGFILPCILNADRQGINKLNYSFDNIIDIIPTNRDNQIEDRVCPYKRCSKICDYTNKVEEKHITKEYEKLF
jgi:hypothetical protein